MSKETYFPPQKGYCDWSIQKNRCTFCFFNASKRCDVRYDWTIPELIGHFDRFAHAIEEKNGTGEMDLIIPVNGSWFPQIEPDVRRHIVTWATQNRTHAVIYELRATLADPASAEREFTYIHMRRSAEDPEFAEKYPFQKWLDGKMASVLSGINEISEGQTVMFGYEIPSDSDREILKKGIHDEDYRRASDVFRTRGAKIGANILVQPPFIDDPIDKAFLAVKRAVSELHASRILLSACLPAVGAPVAHKAFKDGLWNTVSATAFFEVVRIVRELYPEVEIVHNSMRIHAHHRNPYAPGRYTEEQKAMERSRVQNAARRVFNT